MSAARPPYVLPGGSIVLFRRATRPQRSICKEAGAFAAPDGWRNCGGSSSGQVAGGRVLSTSSRPGTLEAVGVSARPPIRFAHHSTAERMIAIEKDR